MQQGGGGGGGGGNYQFGVSGEINQFAAAATGRVHAAESSGSEHLQQQQQHMFQKKPGEAGVVEGASPISSRPPTGSFEELVPATGGFADEDMLAGEEAERGLPGNRWPRQETLALLKIRSEMDTAFREATLKGPLWEDVSRKLAELGYIRSSKKCREKFENVHKYYKRTKEARAGRQACKTYRFFSQLEALHGTAGATTAAAATAAMPVPSGISTPLAAIPISIGIGIGGGMSTSPMAGGSGGSPVAGPPGGISFGASGGAPVAGVPPVGGISFSSNSSSGSEEDSEEETEECLPSMETRKRKRPGFGGGGAGGKKMRAFLEGLMKEVMDRQEAMQERFLETIEKREQERMIREEAWRRQEMARLGHEHELMAQERAMAASREAAMITFLQKVTGQTLDHLPKPGPVAISTISLPPQSQPIPKSQPQPEASPPPPPQAARPPQAAPLPKPPQPQPSSSPRPPTQPPQPHHDPKLLRQETTPPPPPPPPPSPPPPPLVPQPSQSTEIVLHINPQSSPTDMVALHPPHSTPTAIVPVQMHQQYSQPHREIVATGNFEFASSRWPKPEVVALIKLRSGLEPRYQEAGPKGPLWEEISAGMLGMGYHRSAKRCKEKWENINKYYKKVKDSNKKRPEDAKTCPYYHLLDGLYRNKLLSGGGGDGGTSSASGPQPAEQDLEIYQNISPQEKRDVLAIRPHSKPQTTQTEIKNNNNNNNNENSTATSSNGDLPPSILEGGVNTKPEDIVKQLMERRLQRQQQSVMEDYKKLDQPDSDDLEQEDSDDDEDHEKDTKSGYKIHDFERENAGSSNGGGRNMAAILAVVQ